MHFSQNSSDFRDVRVMGARVRPGSGIAGGVARCRALADEKTKMKRRSASFLASNFKFNDNQIFAAHCVNVADQMQFQRDAPLSPNIQTQM